MSAEPTPQRPGAHLRRHRGPARPRRRRCAAQPVAGVPRRPCRRRRRPGRGLPPAIPPPPPPRRDRAALAVVLFVFGGLFLVFFAFLLLAYSAVRGETPRFSSGPRIGVVEVKGEIGGGLGRGERRRREHAARRSSDSSTTPR